MDIHSLMNDAPAPGGRSQHHAPEQQQQQQQQPQHHREGSQQQRNSFPPPPQRSASGTYSSIHGSPLNAPPPPPPPPPPGYYAPKPQVPAYQHNASLPSTPMGALHTPQPHHPGGQYPFPTQQSPQQVYPHITPRQQSQSSYHQHSMSPTPPTLALRSPHVYSSAGSQPSTPFGAPMQSYARPSAAAPVPVQHQQQHHHHQYHQQQHQQQQQQQQQPRRSVSVASYALQQSISSQSPAQSIPPPSAYASESPQSYHKRPSTDYLPNAERDRSLSVSPKTKLVLPTRNNSQDTSVWSERDRFTSNEPPHASHRSSADMSNSQAISPLTTTKYPPKASPSSQPRIGSQTPQLRNLLNDDPVHHHHSPMMVSSPAASHAPSIPPPPQFAHSQSSVSNGSPVQTFDSRPIISQEPPSAFPPESLLQQPVSHSIPQPQHSTLKRSAESEPERSDPPKKTKKRYAEPPIWARYAPGNPRYDPKLTYSLGPPDMLPSKRPSPRPALQVVPPQQNQQQAHPPPPQPPAANGHAPPHMANGQPPAPSAMNPHLGPWECNITNMEPIDPLVRHVADFLYREMLSKPDVGVGDPRNGALEIEAKLGSIIDRSTDQRLRLPVTSPVILNTQFSQNLRFESFMTEGQHKCMNDFLNKRVQESIQPNRVKMEYKHRYEIDSFAPFTPAGIEVLPQSAKNYLDEFRRRNLRLRTTVNERAPQGTDPVIARIVKIRLANLDIFSPTVEFDCRISINIEVDMNNRPDIDLSLVVDTSDAKSGGERKKDRLSYKHLAYSVDLTQVKTPDGSKVHELEIEVDAERLREQAERAQTGSPEAFETMVKGLVSNVFTLMRVPVPPRR